MAKSLDVQVEAFRTRPLDAGPYTFVWLDALTLKVREHGRTVNVHALIAVGVNADGQREVLGLDVVSGEDGAGWLAFLRSLVARGLSGVALVISDAHRGLVGAIGAALPGASWQRCRTHYLRNLLTKVPKSAQPWVLTLVRTVFDQPDADAVHAQFDRVVDGLAEKFPAAAEHLDAARGDLLAFTVFPRELWRQIWSNNPQERLNKEIRRRTDVVGIFPDRTAVIRLVGAVLAEQAHARHLRSPSATKFTMPRATDGPDRRATRSAGFEDEPSLIDTLDEARLALMTSSQCGEPSPEPTHLIAAVGDDLQILEQGDRGVVLARLAGGDHRLDAGPATLHIRGESGEAMLSGRRTLPFPDRLLLGTHRLGTPVLLLPDDVHSIQQLSNCPTQTLAGRLPRLQAHPAPQLRPGDKTLAPSDQQEQPVLLTRRKPCHPGGQLLGPDPRVRRRRARLRGDLEQIRVQTEEVRERALWRRQLRQPRRHRRLTVVLMVLVERALVAVPRALGRQPTEIERAQVTGRELGPDPDEPRQRVQVVLAEELRSLVVTVQAQHQVLGGVPSTDQRID